MNADQDDVENNQDPVPDLRAEVESSAMARAMSSRVLWTRSACAIEEIQPVTKRGCA